MDELGVDRSLMFPTLASLIEERLSDDPLAIHVIIHALNEWLHEVWGGFNHKGRIFTTPVITLPIVEKAIEELEWAVKRGARAILIRPAPVPASAGRAPSRCRNSIPSGSGSCTTHLRRHALVGQRLLALHLRMGRRRAGDAAVPDQRDVDPQRVAPHPGCGGLLGDPRCAVPLPEAEGWHRRGRLEVDVPAAGFDGRGVQEGPRGLPGQPDGRDQEPHLRQPVLRRGYRRPDQPDRCGPGALRIGLAAPRGPGRATHYITALEHLALEDQAKIMGGNLGRLITA